MEELRSKGNEPYAYSWDRTHTANQLQETYKTLGNGEESSSEVDLVSIAGRIVARRAFGKLAFLTLRDDSGTIQVCFFSHNSLLCSAVCIWAQFVFLKFVSMYLYLSLTFVLKLQRFVKIIIQHNCMRQPKLVETSNISCCFFLWDI